MTPSSQSESSLVCVIKPDSGSWLPDLRGIWRYRELFWALVMKDVTARYKQTYLGFAWAVIVPFMQMMVFNVIFGLTGVREKLVSGTVPFILTAFAANLAWQVFASGAGAAGGSILGSAGMIKKVYFPRIIVPMTAVVRSLMDCAIMFACVLVPMMAYYHFVGGHDMAPSWRLLFLPAFVALAVAMALAVGVWMAALQAKWRDLGFVLPFVFSLGQYASPVIYEASKVPDNVRWRAWMEKHHAAEWLANHGLGAFTEWVRHLDPQAIYGLNPMAGVIEGFRWSLFGGHGNYQAPGGTILVSVVVILVVLVSGLWYFKRAERDFVDIL